MGDMEREMGAVVVSPCFAAVQPKNSMESCFAFQWRKQWILEWPVWLILPRDYDPEIEKENGIP